MLEVALGGQLVDRDLVLADRDGQLVLGDLGLDLDGLDLLGLGLQPGGDEARVLQGVEGPW